MSSGEHVRLHEISLHGPSGIHVLSEFQEFTRKLPAKLSHVRHTCMSCAWQLVQKLLMQQLLVNTICRLRVPLYSKASPCIHQGILEESPGTADLSVKSLHAWKVSGPKNAQYIRHLQAKQQ